MADNTDNKVKFKLPGIAEAEEVILSGTTSGNVAISLSIKMDHNIKMYEELIDKFISKKGDPLDQLLYRMYKEHMNNMELDYTFDDYLRDSLIPLDDEEDE